MNKLLSEMISQIPDELKDVLTSIKQASSIPVVIREYNNDIEEEMSGFTKASAFYDIDLEKNSITIWVCPERVSLGDLCHEIVHLRRDILESVPKLFPLASLDAETIHRVRMFESELEHQFVIPEQIKLFPESRNWWIDHYEEQLLKSQENELALCLHWCLLRTVFPNDNETIVKSCVSYLRARNKKSLLEFASGFQYFLKEAMPDKLKMIKVMLDYLSDFFPDLEQQTGIARYIAKDGKLFVEGVE